MLSVQLMQQKSAFLKTLTNSFYKIKSQSIVEDRFKKQSIFTQIDLNPYHLPPIKRRKHNDQVRKIMQDQSVQWEHDPKNYPAAVKESGSRLIKKLENEEIEKIKSNKLRKDSVQLGDKVEVEYYESITSKKLFKYKGVVLEVKRKNSLTHCFKVLLSLKAENLIVEYMFNSPMLYSVKVLGRNGEARKNKIFNARDLAKYGNKIERLLEGGKKVSMNKRDLKQLKMMESTAEQIVVE